MPLFLRNDLDRLLKSPGGDGVSIYLPLGAPHHRSGDGVRLNGLIDEAESQWQARGATATSVREVLAPARSFVNVLDTAVGNARGLALFAREDHFETVCSEQSFSEGVFVQPHYQILPLLPLVARNEARFHVLAISQNRVRLFDGSAKGLREREVAGLPRNMTEALNLHAPDTGIQFHGGTRQGKQSPTTVYHGQGGQGDYKKEELTAFFRIVDAAVAPALRGSTSLVFLACVDYLVPLYRKVSECGRLADEHVSGNFDHASPDEIFATVWPLIERRIEESLGVTAQQCAIAVEDDPAASELAPVLRAARCGRVDKLVVALDQFQWGRFDAANDRVHFSKVRMADDEELFNLAAILALEHGGDVVAISGRAILSGKGVAGLFRYATPRARLNVLK